jgi:prolyl oligopeptidase
MIIAATGFVLVAGTLEYPVTKRVDHIDTYHGTQVSDPYRWLEDDVRTSEDVAQWVQAQNEVTFQFLGQIKEREGIKNRLTELWNYEKVSAPFKSGGRYYFFKNDGLQNQSVLYTMASLGGEEEVFMDPNTWSEDGTIALAGLSFSPNGRYVAYGIQESGSDWRTWKVMRVADRAMMDDHLSWLKFGGISWTADNQGFFYSKFQKPQEGQSFQSLNLNQKVYYHRLGTAQDEDIQVFSQPDHPEWGFLPTVTEDGQYLIITVWVGTDDRYRVFVKDLSLPYGQPLALIDTFEHEFSFLGNDGGRFYFKTNLNAPKGRVIAIDFPGGSKETAVEIIPESKETLEGVQLVNNMMICQYLKDAKSQVKLFDTNGSFIREVQFPSDGTARGFDGKRSDNHVFYTFSSFNRPPTIYHYDLITGKSTIFKSAKVAFNPDDYVVEQVFYPSKDGTQVPMFLSYKKGLKKNGKNPTLLYGYGGFNISLTPGFRIDRLVWMEMGGIFATANLRGGGEYGQAWHQAGTKLQKQNVFDDFIAAAEWLIEKKYTQTKKLAIMGGSNGGLLVGAVMTQRPELFGACLPAVGVMDMLRFHQFTAGRYWVDDYGSADHEEQFKALYAYSPYHNLKEGVSYPPTMVTTADTDDRVVPGHSFKFAAQLQHCHKGDNPVLIRIETKAGHGSGKPTSKIIEEVADEWAFLVNVLDMDIKF